MKTIFSWICLLVVLAPSTFVFGNTKGKEESEKIYIRSNEVVCSEKGIFIKHGKEFLRAKSIAFDENGIYVRKGWVYRESQSNDDDSPRGGHHSNIRPSAENKHQEGEARRKREQDAARARKEEAKRRGRRGR